MTSPLPRRTLCAMVSLLVAVFLAAHGLIHGLFLAPRPPASASGPTWPFDLADSWLVSHAGLEARWVALVGGALAVLTAVGFGLSALATAGLIVPPGLWRPLVLGSAATSVVLLGLFFHPTLIVGFFIDAVLMWIVVALSWTPALDGY